MANIDERSQEITRVNISMMVYTRNLDNVNISSGAYLFVNNGLPRPFLSYLFKKMQVSHGPIYDEIDLIFFDKKRPNGNMSTKVCSISFRLYKDEPIISLALYIQLYLDILKLNSILEPSHGVDVEVILKIDSDVDNGKTFYTDSNGFQMMKRYILKEAPLSGNYYPITSMMFIEDDRKRLTVHTGTSLGAGSNSAGSLELMLDRHLVRDDNRGLGEGVTDNVALEFDFILSFDYTVPKLLNAVDVPAPTTLSWLLNDLLNRPSYILQSSKLDERSFHFNNITLPRELPCNVHLLSLKPGRDDKTVFMILHWRSISSSFYDAGIYIYIFF